MDKEYKVDDEVWIVRYPLVIRCKIARVDDYFRKQHPAAYLFYDPDEPIGHSLAVDELHDTFDDAKATLLEWHQDHIKYRDEGDCPELWDSDEKLKAMTLTLQRERTIFFVKKTWQGANVPADEYAKMDAEFHIGIYPNKERGKDWFNVFDLIGE